MFYTHSRSSRLSILCLVFGIAVGIGYLFSLRTKQMRIRVMPTFPSLAPVIKNKAKATPWVSPDGKKTLIMKTAPGAKSQTVYSFFVSNSASEAGKLVYTVTHDASTTMSIPFNAWSPGNLYFFIQEHDGTTRTLVFKASGETFPDTQAYLNVNDLFAQKKSGYIFDEVTGWADPTLLVINTKTEDGKNGSSFWFDVSRKSLIRLATLFR